MMGREREDWPSYNALYRRFGGKGELTKRFRVFAESRPDLTDVLSYLPEAGEARQSSDTNLSSEGWVYLLRSGQHHKIGRSDTLERRIREIGIALPSSLLLVHAIRTDDPPGIESYWHRRFAASRANGEWFRLSASDVKAFKRRKYQ
jgi:hypothetical protein